MANFFKSLFGYPEKRDTTYTGQKPIGPLETDLGKKLRSTLEERMAGQGVGFSPDFVSATTAPYATARREGLQRYEIPQISQQASARGLGRSTIPINRIALSGQEAERDIEQRVAQATQLQEQQKRSEINDALARYQQLTGDVTAAQNLKSEFDHADYLQQLGRADQAEAQRTAALQKITTTLGGAALGGMKAMSTPVVGSLGGVSGFASNASSNPLLGAVSGALGGYSGNAALTNIGGNQIDLEDFAKLARLIYGGA